MLPFFTICTSRAYASMFLYPYQSSYITQLVPGLFLHTSDRLDFFSLLWLFWVQVSGAEVYSCCPTGGMNIRRSLNATCFNMLTLSLQFCSYQYVNACRLFHGTLERAVFFLTQIFMKAKGIYFRKRRQVMPTHSRAIWSFWRTMYLPLCLCCQMSLKLFNKCRKLVLVNIQSQNGI